MAFCFLTFSKFFNLVYYTGFMGKSKKFILASLYPLAKACGFSDLKISIRTTSRSNFGSCVCMERPVGIVTSRALLCHGYGSVNLPAS